MRFESPVGAIVIVATERGVSKVIVRPRGGRACRADVVCSRGGVGRARRLAERMRRQLGAYFGGRLRRFDVPLDLSSGTRFQQRVWRACRAIPHGEVWSYGRLAKRSGCARAARAVGGAMGANPLPIVVPCHRVVRSDGTLGGYGLGVPLKRRLLGLEGSAIFRAASPGAGG